MIKGFVDHWCPTKPEYASWWNAPFEVVREDLLRLMDRVDFDNFTFYTKWYTNGIYTRLPYLRNYPEASNAKTQNDWGRSIVELLRANGKSAGFMLQLLCFEPAAWGGDMAISMEPDCLFDISLVAPAAEKLAFADFTQELYQQRVVDIIKEHIAEFPGVEYLFLEFEGLIVNRKLSRYVCEKFGKSDPVTFSGKALEHCHDVMFDLDHSWSNEFAQICGQYMGSLFSRIDAMLKRQGYKGKVGVVFYAWGYESLYMPEILPDPQWWLLPWDYPDKANDDSRLYTGGNRFVIPWDGQAKQAGEVCRRRIHAIKENLLAWKRRGLKQCYIGNGTIKSGTAGITEELFRLCEKERLDGYLAMGTPLCERGLRWPDFTGEDALAAAELYKKLYRK
jgi:hypothetical protein